MEADIIAKLTILEAKIDESQKYTKRLYTIFVWTGVFTVAMFVLPLIGLLFVIPQFISTLGGGGGLDSVGTPAGLDNLNAVSNYAKTIHNLVQ
jgi:hypothetical protein